MEELNSNREISSDLSDIAIAKLAAKPMVPHSQRLRVSLEPPSVGPVAKAFWDLSNHLLVNTATFARVVALI